MKNYIYQNWLRGYRELHNEKDTLNYYLKHIHYPDERADEAKAAKKFLKNCTSAEDWVRYAYANDLPYCVCKTDILRVESYIIKELVKDKLSVSFLDEYQRVFMIYVFKRQPNGRYFCIGIMFWEFEEGKSGDNDDLKSWIYTFETNGHVEVIERETGSDEECVWKSKRPLNVESNWEPSPDFGNWEGLMKMERWQEGELSELFKSPEIDTKEDKKQAPKPNRPPGATWSLLDDED